MPKTLSEHFIMDQLSCSSLSDAFLTGLANDACPACPLGLLCISININININISISIYIDINININVNINISINVNLFNIIIHLPGCLQHQCTNNVLCQYLSVCFVTIALQLLITHPPLF